MHSLLLVVVVMVVVLTATWVPFAAVGEVVVVVGDVGTDAVLAILAAGDWPAIFAAGDWVAAFPVPRDAMFPGNKSILIIQLRRDLRTANYSQ